MKIEAALKFIKLYHPELWEQVDELNIIKLIKYSHDMFVTHPELLEATNNLRQNPPTQ